jgi:hypothetical protein
MHVRRFEIRNRKYGLSGEGGMFSIVERCALVI